MGEGSWAWRRQMGGSRPDERCGQALVASYVVGWYPKDALIDAAPMQGGWTALMRAAERGHTKAVELLLDRGADIEATANVSRLSTSLDAACEASAFPAENRGCGWQFVSWLSSAVRQ